MLNENAHLPRRQGQKRARIRNSVPVEAGISTLKILLDPDKGIKLRDSTIHKADDVEHGGGVLCLQ